MLSKNQALAGAIQNQCAELLGLLATARGRLKVVDYAVLELLPDELSRRGLVGTVAAISDAIDEAGTQAKGLLDRVEHVVRALES